MKFKKLFMKFQKFMREMHKNLKQSDLYEHHKYKVDIMKTLRNNCAAAPHREINNKFKIK